MTRSPPHDPLGPSDPEPCAIELAASHKGAPGSEQELVDILHVLELLGVEVSVHHGKVMLEGAGVLPPDLLEALRRHEAALIARGNPVLPEDARTDYPASCGQARLAYLDLLWPRTAAYNVSASLILRGHCDLDRLFAALRVVLERHPAFRSHLVSRDQPRIRVSASPVGSPELVDLSNLPPPRQADELSLLRRQVAATRFDITTPPLWRCVVIKRDPALHEVLLCIHHLIADGWSLARSLQELGATYAALGAGMDASFPPVCATYTQYSAWQRWRMSRPAARAEAAWWQDALTDYSLSLTFPTDRPRPPVASDRGDRIMFELSEALTDALRRFAAAHRCTVAAVVSAAYTALLHRYTGTDKFLIGMALSSRPVAQLEHVVGFFVEWLPVPADFSGRPSFEEFLQRWETSRRGALRHQDIPFDVLVRGVRRTASLSHHPLFQHMVVAHVPARKVTFGDLSASLIPLPTGTSKLDTTLFLTDAAHAIPIDGYSPLVFELEYRLDLFDRATMEALVEAFRILVAEAIAAPASPLRTLPLARTSRKGAAEPPATEAASLLQLVWNRVAAAPDAAAIIDGSDVLGYREVWTRASQVATALAEHGVAKGDRVALMLPRGADQVIGLLGALLAGAVFVPIDLDLPDQRMRQLILDSEPRVVLSSSEVSDRMQAAAPDWRSVMVEDTVVNRAVDPCGRVASLGPSDPAYLLYTSGSTGAPKGVLGAHGPLASFLYWLGDYLSCGGTDRVLCKTSLAFDAAMRELLAPLCCGATLVLASDSEHREPAALAGLIARHGVTIVHATPTVYRELLREFQHADTRSLRHVMLGGEKLDTRLAADHFAWIPHVRLHNVYGPTECTIDVTVREVVAGDVEIPIGRPIPGAIVYVGDDVGAPMPTGALGEIFIGGRPVCLGYWRRPAEHAARFLPVAHGPAAGSTVYRTGDLGRSTTDGVLQLIGRADRQVKIHGARVELGEIEQVLRGDRTIRAATAVAIADPVGRLRIVAFVQLEPSESQEREAPRLRRALIDRLPSYMVPSELRFIDKLPLLVSGKTDTAALMAISSLQIADAADELSADEAVIAELMSGVLGVDVVSPDTDFFAAGGHSLSATRLLGRIARRLGVVLKIRELFEAPTVRSLARAIRDRSDTTHRDGASAPPLTASIRPGASHD